MVSWGSLKVSEVIPLVSLESTRMSLKGISGDPPGSYGGPPEGCPRGPLGLP